MFGLLGAALYGLICTNALADEKNREHKARNDARQSGSSFYIDNSGRMRHTGSGRIYSPEEVHQAFFPESLEEKQKKHDQMMYDQYHKKYWCVYNTHVDTSELYKVIEVFLTKEEAEKYLNDNMDDLQIFKFVSATCRYTIEHDKNKKYNKHFKGW